MSHNKGDVMRIKLHAQTRTLSIDGRVVFLDKSQKVRSHSPDGFNWGYDGGGPAQLALAILLEVTTEEIAVRHYQSFKREFVATWAGDFDVDETVNVLAWVWRKEFRRAVEDAKKDLGEDLGFSIVDLLADAFPELGITHIRRIAKEEGLI